MAKVREKSRVRLLGVTGRKRSDLLIGTALQATTLLVLALPAAAQPAPNARPAGGSVVAGSATISQSLNATTINQASQQAAINWQSFNVGAQQAVTFVQPSSSAIALNRVIGPDPSQIAGRIDANGQIVLTNQAGVTFYKGAQVNAQSLIVTTSNISNANFMAGHMIFDQAGNPNASVVNQGTITVKQAGLAALVAPRVANSGVINAQMGHVVLAGAKTATLDLYGDGLLALDVSNQVTQVPVGPGGKKVTALVTNSGVISANGGTVQLTAAAADGVLQNLVQAGGKISANTVGTQTGTVTIAGIGGSVNVTGLVSASGTTGGQVAVNATGDVTLGAKARINASGAAGGGTVAIGTTLARAIGGPGTVATMTAANVTVRKGARINASAIQTGNGGRVTVLSANNTRMAGTISATGGGLTGNGGFVEVSGDNLGLTGMVHIGAPHGQPGTLLLDPTDLDIIASVVTTANSVDSDFNATGTLSVGAGSPMPSTVSANTIQSIASEGDVVLRATGSIDVQASVFVFNNFTLQAGGNLTIESGVSLQGGGNILLQAGMVTPSGALTINGIVQSLSGSGVTQLISGTGGIAFNGNLTTATLDLITTGGGVTEASGAGMIVNAGLTSSLGVVGNVSLLGGGNHIATIENFTVTGGNFQMANVDSYAITGNLSTPGGNVYLQDSDPEGIEILVGAGVTTAPTGTASFQADGFLLAGQASLHGNVVSGTFELAPNSIGLTETLGAQNVSFGLALPSLLGITATQVRFGAVTLPNTVTPAITAGTISIAGPFDSLNRSLELDASTSVDGTPAPLVNVGTLSGGGTADWFLEPPTNSNTIANLGNVAAHVFEMTDSIGLTVAGTVNTAVLEIVDTGNLAVNGVINSAEIILSADNIDIPGVLNNGGAVEGVSLVANVGTITETGTIIAGGLVGSAVGAVNLAGATPSTNQVTVLGSAGKLVPPGFTASSFTLLDGVALTVDGAVTATSPTGQVFLATTAPAGIGLTANGGVTANATTGIVSLQADSFVNGGAVSGNTVQFAPATAGGTVTLGATGTGLSLLSLAGLTTNNLLVGAVTPPGGGAPAISAGGIAIGGAFAFTATGTLTLDAAAVGGATGAVTQTAPLTGVSVLAGTANSFALTNSGNAIGTLANLTATTADLDVVSANELFADGVSAILGSVFLSSPAAGGVVVDGPASAGNRVGIQANAFSLTSGGVHASTFELAPLTNGAAVTLGSTTGGLSLLSLAGITAGTVRIGAVTPPGGAAPVISAGAITIAGPFSAAGAGTLELDAGGAISQSAPLLNVSTLSATGASVVLTNTGNLIGAGSGITATTGNIVLVDDESLTLNGAYSGNDLFFEVAFAGGNLTIGGSGPATLSAATGASISLVADGLSANTTGSIGNAGGTVQLAPFSAVNVSLAGTGGSGTTFSAALLSNVNVGGGTLLIGGYTNLPAGSSALTTTAGAITLNGVVNLSGRAGTLVLLADGAVTEPGGPLTVGTVTGVSNGDFSLSNTANQIQASTGVSAANGDVVVVDDPTMTLTGTYTGNNLFFQVTQPGGSLALGDANTPAVLVASTGGRVSLVADGITATAASTITVPAGTLEVAPFSAINESVLGTNATGQLLVGATLLADVTGGMLNTLVIGGYTPVLSGGKLSQVSSGALPSASAGSVTLDGALNLTALATNLDLLSAGSVTEPGGPLTVANVFGDSAGNFFLTNTANAIGQSLGIASGGGDVVLVDGVNLALVGAHTGNNLFFEVAAQGGTLSVGATGEVSSDSAAQLTAANGGRISLVADHLTENAASTVTAPAGTLELAPFSAVNVSVFGGPTAGPFLVDPTMLSIVTPGLAMLVVGGFTNEPAGATSPTPSASSLSVDGTVTLAPFATGLNLEATGAVTQVAPLVNVGTLAATGSSVVLANAGNLIGASSSIAATAGNIVLVDGENLALNGAYTGNNLFFEVAAKGGDLTIGGSAPATLTAAAGARISLVADGLSANTTGSIGNAGGTVELAPFSAIDVSLAGSGTSGMVVNAALLSDINVGGGTLLVGGYTNLPAGSSAVTTTAGSITLDGAVNLAGRAGTLVLLANGSVTEPGGPLTVGTVTGVSTGDFSLSNTENQLQASTGITANNGSVVLVDDPTMQLTGTYSGTNLFFQVTQPGGSLALGDAAAPAVLVAAGRISLVADSMTATATSTITNPSGTLELAPFSAINESLAGTNGTGQLLVDGTLLADIGSALNLLVIGGYTPLVNGTVPTTGGTTTSASGVTIDGALNLTTRATELELVANGRVTEPGGPVSVDTVFGRSAGTFSLANPANAIARSVGIAATGGDVAVVDGVSLNLTGTYAADNLFFEVAAHGGTLSLGGTIGVVTQALAIPAVFTAASGDRITLVADHMTESGGGSLTAAGGTVELAPFSAINTSLLGNATSGQLLIDPTLLSLVTPGLSTLRVGGFTNEPAGAISATPSAGSISIDGTVNLASVATTFDLQAIGAVTQSAPIVNVGTLTGTTGSTALSNGGNTVGTLGAYTASNGFALSDATNLLIAGMVSAGPSANVSVNGALTETGGITATRLSGSAIGTANLSTNIDVAELDNFSVGGTSGSFTLAPTGNLLIAGAVSATRIVVSAPSNQITLGDGASFVTGGNLRPTSTIPPSSLLPLNGAPGVLLQAADVVQIGHGGVTGQGGGASTLQISVTGNVQFDSHSGLSANGTWLILTLTTGTATGDVLVKALDVSYTPLAPTTPGGTATSLGGANLFGTVNGVSGVTAAGLSFIQPTLNTHYLLNNCEIGSAACLVNTELQILARLQTETAIFVPATSLLSLITPALVLDPEDSDNLLEMPVVSKEDY